MCSRCCTTTSRRPRPGLPANPSSLSSHPNSLSRRRLMSKLSARLVLPMAFVLCAVMAALAADAPRLEIQSPKDGSTINSGAVMIKFKTDHFKVISLKNEANAPAANPAMSENAPMSASQPSPGMGPSGGAPGATTTSPNQPPNNDTVAMQKPDTSGMPANQQSLPQGEANAANARE